MPKITITFDIPEEQSEYDISNSAMKFYISLWEYSQVLRDYTKYGYNTKDIKTAEEMVEALREKFYQTLENNSINLDSYN